jgi:hypothetical protein
MAQCQYMGEEKCRQRALPREKSAMSRLNRRDLLTIAAAGASALVAGPLFAAQWKTKIRKALTERQILAWAMAHYAATGLWPGQKTGPVAASPGDRWNAIDQALARGLRGLPGGLSLARLLRKHGVKQGVGL